MMRRAVWLLPFLVLAACAGPQPLGPTGLAPSTTVTHTVVDETAGEDAAMAALVAPYREQFEAEMNEVIAEATVLMPAREPVPESLIGNLATDAMRAAASEATGEPVDVAVANHGGLRVPVGPGPVTRGLVYELMPFDNFLVVLGMTGVQVDSLAQQIARRGGEPVAGLSFVIEGGRARDLTVGGEPLDRARTYRVVTSNFLADGGDGLSAFGEAASRTELSLLIRDVLLERFAVLGTLAPTIEGRIRLAD